MHGHYVRVLKVSMIFPSSLNLLSFQSFPIPQISHFIYVSHHFVRDCLVCMMTRLICFSQHYVYVRLKVILYKLSLIVRVIRTFMPCGLVERDKHYSSHSHHPLHNSNSSFYMLDHHTLYERLMKVILILFLLKLSLLLYCIRLRPTCKILSKPLIKMCVCCVIIISLAENQQGVIQLFNNVPLRTRRAVQRLWLYSALLVLSGTSLNSDNALLVLTQRLVCGSL